MLPALLGRKVEREASVMVGVSGKATLRQGDWALIAAPSGLDNSAPEPDWFRDKRSYTSHGEPYELFNLRNDPAQRNNRAHVEGERVNAMLAMLERYRRDGRGVPNREGSRE
jgi:arylsulfatase A-like enzyme